MTLSNDRAIATHEKSQGWIRGKLFLSCCLIGLNCPCALQAAWIKGKAEGWAWYEEPAKEQRVQQVEERQSASEQIQQLRKELEEALSTAILHPTEENVVAYMRLQQHWVNQSAQFSQEWVRALLQHPGLDHTASTMPSSQYGLQLHNHQQLQKRESLIKGLTEQHGLFLFYQGKDPGSLLFQQVVQQLARKYNWSLLAISVDGVEIEGFEFHRQDNGISQTFGVELFPALYVVSPSEKEAVPVSFGFTSLDKIEENIVSQFERNE